MATLGPPDPNDPRLAEAFAQIKRANDAWNTLPRSVRTGQRPTALINAQTHLADVARPLGYDTRSHAILEGIRNFALVAAAIYTGGTLLAAGAPVAATAAPAAAGSSLPPVLSGASAVVPSIAGTTAASTVAPVVTTAASTTPSWLSPLLRTAVPVAGQVISSIIQNRGNTAASQLEADSLQKALDYEREKDQYERGRDKEHTSYTRQREQEQTGYDRGQYANYLTRLQPYGDAGPPAVARLHQILGRPGSVPPVSNGALITLRSPDGQTQQVPSEHADWYLSRGATRV